MKRIPKSMQSNLFWTPLHLKLKKMQGLFKDFHRNSRTFQAKIEFKDFSRTPPKIQGLFKTVQTLRQGKLMGVSPKWPAAFHFEANFCKYLDFGFGHAGKAKHI